MTQHHHLFPSLASTLFVLQANPARIHAFDTLTGSVKTILEIQTGVPDGIQVDAESGLIYWTNMGAMPSHGEDFILADGSLERCDLAGESHTRLLHSRGIVTPKQLQLDLQARELYWCDREGMAIYRCSADGDAVTELYRTGTWPEDSSDVALHCVGIALDRQHNQLYWTQKGPPDGDAGRIFRKKIDTSCDAGRPTTGDAELLLGDLPEPIDLDIDHGRQQIYWTDRGQDASGGNSLNRADITNEGLKNHEVLARGLKEGIGLALAPQQRKAYVTDLSGALRVVSMDGGEFETLHTFPGPLTGICFPK